MRFKLANGGVVASMKQPLQDKDFDKITISNNYEDWYEENGTFVEYGGVIPNLTFTVQYSNPSTHLIRKSSHYASVTLALGVESLGKKGHKFSGYNPYELFRVNLSDLDYGDHLTFTTTDVIPSRGFDKNYTHTVNPFADNWGYSTKDGNEPFENYESETYTQGYGCKLRVKTGGGKISDWATKQKITFSITYNVR